MSDQTSNLGYDAENRLVSVSGAITASFVYDGDGQRVRQTIAGATTYFVGNIYEKTGSIITKYYYAGAQRIAMRVGTGEPYYLLSDHLGSTTVTTDFAGNLVSELAYDPCPFRVLREGAVRSSTGTTPTDYTYTGQYSNVTDFGLMFYNARWYDPSLGRFAEADSIVPPGIQGYDRYAYANNSPLVFTDPTGHFGKHRDDKSDYWNKRNQHKVKNLEATWEKEKAARGLENLVKATSMETSLDPTASVASLFPGIGGGKGTYGPSLNAAKGDGSPFVDWLTRNLTWVGRGLRISWFVDQGAYGLRVIALDSSHGSVDYWHLNSDLKWFQGMNHANIEPAHLFGVFSRWVGGTITDPFLPVPTKFLEDALRQFPAEEIIG